MALESDLTTLLKTVCPRVYPDIAPDPMPVRPFVTYQQVGGEVVNLLANALVDKRNARMQINVCADTRLAASALAGQIEDAMKLAAVFQARPIGTWVSQHEPQLRLFGAMQDFTIWYAR